MWVMSHWSNIAEDPNDVAAIAFRKDTVVAAWRGLVPSRTGYIASLCAGKRVLDIGVVDHTLGRGMTMHRAVAESAAYCLCIDILPAAIEEMRRQGFNVRLCDITRDSLDEKFDLVIAGEVIEHLGNSAGLIEAAARLLLPGGRLILTTPNPYYLARIRDGLRGDVRESVDHVGLHWPSGIAELCERAGLRLDQYRGQLSENTRTLKAKLAFGSRRLLCFAGVSEQCFGHTFIYECTLATDRNASS